MPLLGRFAQQATAAGVAFVWPGLAAASRTLQFDGGT